MVEAAQWISQYCKIFPYQKISLTDLFAGSGVFSLELMHRLPTNFVKNWNMVEMQTAFSTSLIHNLQQQKLKPQIAYLDCLSWLQSHVYSENDYFILNPPHYFEDEGKVSSIEEKRKCLSIKKEYWEEFLVECSKSRAKIFMLLNNQTQLYQYTRKKLKTKIKITQPLAGHDNLLLIH